MSNTIAEMVNAVKLHAAAHYHEGGWDSIIECYDDLEIAEMVKGCSTIESAIALVEQQTSAWDDLRRDVQAEIF